MKKLLFIIGIGLISMNTRAGNPDLETAIIKLREESFLEAREFIDKALGDSKTASEVKFWFYRANIYAALCADPSMRKSVPGAIDTGMNSTIMAIRLDKKEKYLEYPDEKSNDIGTSITLIKMASYAVDTAYKLHNGKDYAAANEFYNLVLQAFTYDKKGDIAKMVGITKNQIRINKAAVAWASGKKNEAISIFKMLVDSNFNDVAIYQQLVMWQLETGDTSAALITCDKGIEQFPNNTMYFMNNQLVVYQNRGDLQALFEKLNKSIELEPNNALFVSIRGSIYDRMASKIYREKKISREADSLNALAEKDYLKTIEIDPNDTFTNFALGILYYNRAMPMRERRDNLNKSKPDYKTKLDKLNQDIAGQAKKAEPYLSKAFELKPTDYEHVDAMFRLYALQDKIKEAEEMKNRRDALKK